MMINKNFFSGLLLAGGLQGAVPLLAQQTRSVPIVFSIDAHRHAQTIHNFGASGCWFSENIGKYWPYEKKAQIAEWLFSKDMDEDGNPKGIGLSAWRFNVGGGSAEQGDSSGIKMPEKRVESFLAPDGTWDWTKQGGYQWFLQQAKKYGVETLIAFSNTPPVQFTQNGLGFKTVKDYKANLRSDKYIDYASFWATVLQHFDQQGLHFDYVSPVNEPQWDWSNKFGQASQEGSPWRNEEIYHVLTAVDSVLEKQHLVTSILTTEAGMLNYLYGGSAGASYQIQQFFGDTSALSLRRLKHLPAVIGGHSYFTDAGDSNLVAVRKHVADTAARYGVEYWQTEYSMLADGFREGSKGKRSAIDCALFLAKVMHFDLTVGNAAAWQFWNSYEPGSPEQDTRYFFVALHPDKDGKDGQFWETKNLWAFGQFSRFVRPGMYRLLTSRSDGETDVASAQQVMVSAYAGGKNKLVVVAINYSEVQQAIQFDLKGFGKASTYTRYMTTGDKGEDMKASPKQKIRGAIALPARSISTFLIHR